MKHEYCYTVNMALEIPIAAGDATDARDQLSNILQDVQERIVGCQDVAAVRVADVGCYLGDQIRET